MTAEALSRLESIIKRRLRIAASNPRGLFSSTWMFWGNASDYYFGPRSAVSAMKVSLHKNGIGYLAFEKTYHAALQNDSIDLPRTSLEWKLPADPELTTKTINLGVSDERLAAEISIYYSFGEGEDIDAQLSESGKPMFQTKLDDGRIFYVIARETTYDPAVIPSGPLKHGKQTLLDKNVLTGAATDYEHLNALRWNKPLDGGSLMFIDVGGIKIHRGEERPPESGAALR